jgi:DNA-binding XRE family transcriptional regulator
MKYLFDIDGVAYEIELEKGETKQLEYKKGRFAKVSLHQISIQPTTTDIGSAFLRVEFDNGNLWRSKDAVIPRIITEQERQRRRIGNDIATLRKERGMTQQDVADRADIMRPHIARVELGKYNFGFDTLQAIADALDADIRIVPRQ